MLRPSTIAQLVEGRLRVPSPQKTIHVTHRDMSSYMNSRIARNDDLSRGAYLNRQ